MIQPKTAKAFREKHLKNLKTKIKRELLDPQLAALKRTKEGEYARGVADGFLQGWKSCGLAILKELKS